MFLHTLDNTSWSIADIIGPIGTGAHNFSINFTSNDTDYTVIRFVGDANNGSMYYNETLVATYPNTTWEEAAYQNVAIAGGIDATNPTLLAWFKQYAKNATPSGGDADIVNALNDIAEAISDGGLPDTTEASAGDVLSLDEDKKPTWAAPESGIPAIESGDAGKVLTVNAGATGVEWGAGGGGGEAVILKLNSSFNGLLFEDDTPVNPSNFPYDNVPNVYLKNNDNLFRISRVKTGTTTEVNFIGFAYNQGYTSTVKQFVYYIFRSSDSSTSFSLFTTIVNPALPTIGPNDGGKYLAVKSDGSGLEWVSPPNNDSVN